MSIGAMLQKWAVVLVLVAVSIAVVFIGLYGRQAVLKANPCQMTYSKREKSEVPLCGKNCEHKLWKISNPSNKNLNPQPVLYIPGHLGSANQARSLASHMHDEDSYFQYFSMDFNEGYSAFHGSDILSQAHMTNKALWKIRSMYQKKKGNPLGLESNSTRKVILVGHSVGGMVARAAPLLSSHPNCLVRDIVQLSTPNLRPPYSPDASLEIAYMMINRAWSSVYRNGSSSREMCVPRVGFNTSSANDGEQEVSEGASSVAFGCPAQCLSTMRLVSISGGEIDLEVPVDLSDLNKLFPAPAMAKSALPRQASSGSGSYLNLLIGAGRSAIRSLQTMLGKSLPAGAAVVLNANLSTESTAASPVLAVAVEVLQNASEPSLETLPAAEVVTSSVNTDGTAEASVKVPGTSEAVDSTVITDSKESVSTNTAEPYVPAVPIVEAAPVTPVVRVTEPAVVRAPVLMAQSVQFVSLRSSQLTGVGFPIDHAAVVWCHDLLHAVSNGLRKLSKLSTQATVDWVEVFPQVLFNTTAPLGTYEHHMNVRQQAKKRWADASIQETSYISSKFPIRFLYEVPFAFVHHHLVKVVACYVIVCCLALFAPIVRVLTGNSEASALIVANNWDGLLLGNQFSLDLVGAAVFSALRTSVPPTMWKHMFSMVYQLVAFVMLFKGAYDYFFGTFEVSTYTEFVYWAIAYFLAVAIRAVVLATVQVVHRIFGFIFSVIRTILRLTVWNQAIRRAVRSSFKSVNKWGQEKLPYYTACTLFLQRSVAPTAVTSLWMAVYLTTKHRLQHAEHLPALGRVTYGLSVLAVVAYAIMLLGLLAALVYPPRNTISKGVGSPNSYYVDLILLYIPVPVVALPTFFYSARLLYGTAVVFPSAASLYGVFDVDRAIYCVAVAAVGVHLWTARSISVLPHKVKPLRWLYELLGPSVLQAYIDVFGSTYSDSYNPTTAADGGAPLSLNMAVNSGQNGCMHEDGGRNAVFEEILAGEQGIEKVDVAKGVVLGSTYRVVSCNCAKDTTLADITEWCAWCRCRKCGGKHLPPEKTRRHHDSSIDSRDLADFTTDLIPGAVLFAVCGYAVSAIEHSPYLCLYIYGVVAIAYICREAAHALYQK